VNILGIDPKQYVSESNYILPIVGYRLAQAYNWSPSAVKNLNFIDFYRLSDAIIGENFEGNNRRANFSEFDWYLIRNSQKITANKSVDLYGLKLYNTK
jgi:hypothetical protein